MNPKVVEADMRTVPRRRNVNAEWLKEYHPRLRAFIDPPAPGRAGHLHRAQAKRANDVLAIVGEFPSRDGSTVYFGIWRDANPTIPTEITQHTWSSIKVLHSQSLLTNWTPAKSILNRAGDERREQPVDRLVAPDPRTTDALYDAYFPDSHDSEAYASDPEDDLFLVEAEDHLFYQFGKHDSFCSRSTNSLSSGRMIATGCSRILRLTAA